MNRFLSQQALILKHIRYAKALELFSMMHLHVTLPSSHITIMGVGRIMHLPLLNSGNMLASPVDAVCMAIYYIAQLVDTLSVVLNVPLPYHIELGGVE
ncbi:hypothetical protein EON65_59040, partial [archaeon]